LPEAKRSIRGKVLVTINVDADPSGAVTSATLSGPNSSRYFSNQSLKAVRQWKFQPTTGPQRWQVRFEFQPSGTKTTQQRLTP
jgi:TonB family protein